MTAVLIAAAVWLFGPAAAWIGACEIARRWPS